MDSESFSLPLLVLAPTRLHSVSETRRGGLLALLHRRRGGLRLRLGFRLTLQEKRNSLFSPNDTLIKNQNHLVRVDKLIQRESGIHTRFGEAFFFLSDGGGGGCSSSSSSSSSSSLSSSTRPEMSMGVWVIFVGTVLYINAFQHSNYHPIKPLKPRKNKRMIVTDMCSLVEPA